MRNDETLYLSASKAGVLFEVNVMKIAAISASARIDGNTSACLRIALERLESCGFSTNLIELSSYSIIPCHGCNIECIEDPICPLISEDDVVSLWEEIIGFDCVIWGVPIYGNGVPGLLKCFFDRAQPLGHYEWYWKPQVVAIIIIGSSGHDQVMDCSKFLVEERRAVAWLKIQGWKGAANRPEVMKSIFELCETLKDSLHSHL